jgi:heat shock protein HslJ
MALFGSTVLAASLLALLLGAAPAGTLAQALPEESAAPTPGSSRAPVSGPSAAPTAPEAVPEGTWTVSGYDLLGEGLVAPRRGSHLTVSFLPAGRLEGETACGTYLGGYVVDGDSLHLGVIGVGNQPCRGRREDEALTFTQALSLASRWAATDDGLGILDEAGQLRVALIRDEATSIDGDWQVRGLAGGGGGLRRLPAGSTMAISFDATGQVGGSTGCRELTGRHEVQANVLVIAPITLVGPPCSGPPARRERRFLAALDRVTTWQREGDVLTLLDASGRARVEAQGIPSSSPAASPAPSLTTSTASPSAALPP